MTKIYYAVRKGFKPGIYESWEECQAQTIGYSGPKFRKFKTLKGAEDYLQGYDGEEILDKNFLVFPQAGSDETGNGSFIGPVCVTAAYVDEEIYEKIKHLPIKDTKDVSYKKRVEIGRKLKSLVPYETIILDNQQYNEKYESENNLHRILAQAHNKAFVKLNKKLNNNRQLPKPVIIDDFLNHDEGKKRYLDYLADEDEVYADVALKTQAEGKRISVAIAAYLATYAHYKTIEKMEEKYKFEFKVGSGKETMTNVKEFLNLDPANKSELKNIVKMHWDYYDELI